LQVAHVPLEAAVFNGDDVVDVGGDGAALAERVVEEDSASEELPALA
jgi:hypothetical protein